MKTTDLEKDICPKCGYIFEAATDVESEQSPSPGDWAVCINCATPLQFDENLRQVIPTGKIPEEVRIYQRAVRKVHGIEDDDLQ